MMLTTVLHWDTMIRLTEFFEPFIINHKNNYYKIPTNNINYIFDLILNFVLKFTYVNLFFKKISFLFFKIKFFIKKYTPHNNLYSFKKTTWKPLFKRNSYLGYLNSFNGFFSKFK
jgi:hypothetical protein